MQYQGGGGGRQHTGEGMQGYHSYKEAQGGEEGRGEEYVAVGSFGELRGAWGAVGRVNERREEVMERCRQTW